LAGSFYFLKAAFSGSKIFFSGRQRPADFTRLLYTNRSRITKTHWFALQFFQVIFKLKAMKRICFLLTFFLTGFSLVANQQSLRNTYLLACSDGVYEINLEPKASGEALSEEAEETHFMQPGLAHAGNFICSIGR